MISVVIPTYKNEDQLKRNLENNLKYLKDAEIIVVNDAPETDLKSVVGQFKTVRLITNNENKGFGEAVNIGVRQAKGDYVFLLNSDVILNDSLFTKCIDQFKDISVFAVSISQREKNDQWVGRNKIFWQRGTFFHTGLSSNTSGETAWAEGGSSIIDRKKFIELGGFDSMYKPFYWEDIDLSYRAWKSGYKVLFNSNVTVEHHHESTIGKYFKKKQIAIISFRNQFIFTWKNLTTNSMFLEHLLLLLPNLIYYILKLRIEYVIGFIYALTYIPTIAMARSKSKIYKVSDAEVLNKFMEL